MPFQHLGHQAVECGKALHVANEGEEAHEGGQQAVIHPQQQFPVHHQYRRQDHRQHHLRRHHPQHLQQAYRKEHQPAQQSPPVQGFRLPAGVSGGNRRSPVAQKHTEGQQYTGEDGIGQCHRQKRPQGNAGGGIEVEVLGIADWGEHAAQVRGDGHERHRAAQRRVHPRQVREQQPQRHEGQERNVVCDEHTAEKAEKHQHQRQLPLGADAAQQRLPHPAEQPHLLKTRHHGHQAKQRQQGILIQIPRILPVRRHQKTREHRQDKRQGEHRLPTEKVP